MEPGDGGLGKLMPNWQTRIGRWGLVIRISFQGPKKATLRKGWAKNGGPEKGNDTNSKRGLRVRWESED